MNAKKFKNWLKATCKILNESGGGKELVHLLHFIDSLELEPKTTVRKLCQFMSAAAVESGTPNLSQATRIVSLMTNSAVILVSKSDGQVLKLFADTVSEKRDCELSGLISAVNNALGGGGLTEAERKYLVKQLHDAAGNMKAFEKVYSDITNNPRIKADDAKEIAKEFTGETAKSKNDAFGRIYNLFESLKGTKANADSNDGRSAA